VVLSILEREREILLTFRTVAYAFSDPLRPKTLKAINGN
jgi:hypothetical protein